MGHKTFIALIFFLIAVITDARGQNIKSLVPSVNELKGWKMASEPEAYPGDKLYDLINGGADIYYEYGFVQAVSVRYNDPAQNLIQLEIYEMMDDESAYGIFSMTQQAAQWNTEYGQASAVKEDYISFWKGKYYVIVSWSSRQHQEAPLLSELAGLVEDKIKTVGSYPEIVSLFQATDSKKKTVFLKGNLALSNFYYFDFKDIFEIREGIACTPGDHHRIVIYYPDVQKAQSVLLSSRLSISGNKRFTDVAMSFQGFSCKDNKGNRILIRQEENYIVIIVGLNKTVPLIPLMEEVTRKIESFQ